MPKRKAPSTAWNPAGRNCLLTPEEAGARLKICWDKHVVPYAARRRAEGASEEEIFSEATGALFGSLWRFPDAKA